MTKYTHQLLWFLVPRALRIISLICGLILTLGFLWFIVTQVAGKPGDNISVLIILALTIIGVVWLFAILLHILTIYLLIRGSYFGWIVAVINSVLGLGWGLVGFPCLVIFALGQRGYILLLAWPMITLLRISELYGLHVSQPK